MSAQCTMQALGLPFERARFREMRTLSGGEQKRLVLEALLRGPADVLVLDEPDNYLDVPAKRWLEEHLRASRKTVLLVSHDRELLARAADRIVTLDSVQQATRPGRTAAASPATIRPAMTG
jgi:ATPase subunit of ABC transporter with duplicated ATPase domains